MTIRTRPSLSQRTISLLVNGLEGYTLTIWPFLGVITNENRRDFTTDLPRAVRAASIVFIAVGTPQHEDGSADLSHVLAVARDIAKAMNGYKVIVDKSTVPVGTAQRVRELIQRETKHPFSVVSNPEFLKQGAAVEDFLKPDRVVIGVEDDRARSLMLD